MAWFRSVPRRCAEPPNIGTPGPDLSNFPDSSFTLPQWRAYVETTPFNLASRSSISPLTYNWEVLIRLGITDNIEARIYTGALTIEGGEPRTVGFSPLVFDTKLHLAQRSWRYFNFSLGLEAYVQTRWGSDALTDGIHYGASLLVDHALPWELSYEWNLGFVRALDDAGEPVFVPTFQAALQRTVVDGLAIFLESYRNEVSLPRTVLSKGLQTGRERGTVFGVGLQWNVDARWSLFGSFSVGHGSLAPLLSGSSGVAISL